MTTDVAAAGFDPARDAQGVLEELARRFGPGFSNGIAAILCHENLPDTFNKDSWDEWFFKPAESAFELALDMGLIAPWKLSGRWRMTPLGEAAGALLRAQLRDSDGSPKGGDAEGGSVHDSAGPQGIAQAPNLSSEHSS